MTLWILRPKGYSREGWDKNNTAWARVYDMNHGFIVRAPTEADARKMASQQLGDEKAMLASYRMKGHDIPTANPWLLPEQSTCEELHSYGVTRLIMRDFNAG